MVPGAKPEPPAVDTIEIDATLGDVPCSGEPQLEQKRPLSVTGEWQTAHSVMGGKNNRTGRPVQRDAVLHHRPPAEPPAGIDQGIAVENHQVCPSAAGHMPQAPCIRPRRSIKFGPDPTENKGSRSDLFRNDDFFPGDSPMCSRKLAVALIALLAPTLFVGFASAQVPTFEDQVMELVNQQRWSNGQLYPLKRCDLLDTSAETHSGNMAARNFFAHCDVDTKTMPWVRMQSAGYVNWSFASENIAAGFTTPQAVMTGWMNSSGHRSNILSTSSREIGIGYVYQSGDQNNVRTDANNDCTADASGAGPFGHYWTQNFGRRNTVYPVVINREAFQATNSTVQLYLFGAGWATEMRLRNESGSWSAWQPFAADVDWVLSAGNGAKTVSAEIRNGATTYAASDLIYLNASADVAVALTASTASLPAGQDLVYRLVTTNAGASAATGLVQTDVLPIGMNFVSASKPASYSNGTVTRTLPLLAPGAADTLEILCRPSAAGDCQNAVSVVANEFDPSAANNSATVTTTVTGATAVPGDDWNVVRPVLAIRPNIPNPFVDSTRLAWYQRDAGPVRLSVLDVAGRVVTVLAEGPFPAGEHAVTWDGRFGDGRPAAAGLYFSRVEAAGRIETQKVMVAR